MSVISQIKQSRWSVLVGALLLQLCLGAIYSWGTFTTALQADRVELAYLYSPKYSQANASLLAQTKAEVQAPTEALRQESNLGQKKVLKDQIRAIKQASLAGLAIDEGFWAKNYFGFTGKETSWIFSIGLFFFAITMIIAGRLQDKIGPQKIALLGGVILGLGYLGAGLFGGTNFWLISLFIGVVGGIGIGFGYVCPIAACMKWFPDKVGLITGLAVAGFGAGAFIFIKIAGAWGNLVVQHGVHNTFIVFGLIFLLFCTLGALLLKDPPEGFKPAGWNPGQAKDASAVAGKQYRQEEVIKLKAFWFSWLAFVFSAGCGLMVIKCLKNFGVYEIGMTAAVAGSALGLLSLFNGLGRVVWGSICSKIGAKKAIISMGVLQAMMAMAIFYIGRTEIGLSIAACWLGFNFGGNFALFPLITKEFFGTKYFGQNYGAMFTAYGIGGIGGPILAGSVWDSMQTFKWAFFIAAIACVVSALLIAMANKPGEVEQGIGVEKPEPRELSQHGKIA